MVLVGTGGGSPVLVTGGPGSILENHMLSGGRGIDGTNGYRAHTSDRGESPWRLGVLF